MEVHPLEICESLSCRMRGASLEVDVDKIVAAVATHCCSDIIKSLMGSSGNKVSLDYFSTEQHYKKVGHTQIMGYFYSYHGPFDINIIIEASLTCKNEGISIIGFDAEANKSEYLCEARVSITHPEVLVQCMFHRMFIVVPSSWWMTFFWC